MIKWGQQDNVPISESLTLITPTTSLLAMRQHVCSFLGFGGAAWAGAGILPVVPDLTPHFLPPLWLSLT